MLMKAYDISPEASPLDNFTDAGSTYYTDYLAAAKHMGISSGVGNNMYAPEQNITRQEMFTLLYKALVVLGELPTAETDNTLSSFKDAGEVAAWATEAVTSLVQAGIISGFDGSLNVSGTTTRAEMAQVLYKLLGKQ